MYVFFLLFKYIRLIQSLLKKSRIFDIYHNKSLQSYLKILLFSNLKVFVIFTEKLKQFFAKYNKLFNV